MSYVRIVTISAIVIAVVGVAVLLNYDAYGRVVARPQSARDPAVLERLVRDVNAWGPEIAVQVGEPAESGVRGLVAVPISASFGGGQQTTTFYATEDGTKVIRGSVYDVAAGPFADARKKLDMHDAACTQPSFAQVQVVVFSDFQCEFCRQEAALLRQQMPQAFPSEVRVCFMDYPLESVHPWAKAAAVAGRCVFHQNASAFWKYHDYIFARQPELNVDDLPAVIDEFARREALDLDMLNACRQSPATAAEVAASVDIGRQLEVYQTPAAFINGRRIVDGRWSAIEQIINYELNRHSEAEKACGCELPPQ